MNSQKVSQKIKSAILYFYATNIINFLRTNKLVKESYINYDLELDNLLDYSIDDLNEISFEDFEYLNKLVRDENENVTYNIIYPGNYNLGKIGKYNVTMKVVDNIDVRLLNFKIIKKAPNILEVNRLYITISQSKILISANETENEQDDNVIVIKPEKDIFISKLYEVINKLLAKIKAVTLTPFITVLALVFRRVLELLLKIRNKLRRKGEKGIVPIGNVEKGLAQVTNTEKGITKEAYIALEVKLGSILTNMAKSIYGIAKNTIIVIWQLFVGLITLNVTLLKEAIIALFKAKPINDNLIKAIKGEYVDVKAREKIADLSDQLARAGQIIMYMDEHIKYLQGINKQKDAQIQVLLKTNEELTKQIDKLKKRLELRKKATNYLRELLRRKTNSVKYLRSLNDALKKELEESQNNIKTLKEEISKQTKLLKELETKFANEKNKRTSVTKEYQAKRKQLESVIANLQKQLETEKANYQMLVNTLEKEYKDQIQELEAKLKVAEELIKNKETENNNLKEYIKKLEASNKELQEIIRSRPLVNVQPALQTSQTTETRPQRREVTVYDARMAIEREARYKPLRDLLIKLDANAETASEKQIKDAIENVFVKLVILDKYGNNLEYTDNLLKSISIKMKTFKNKKDLFDYAKRLVEDLTETLPKIIEDLKVKL